MTKEPYQLRHLTDVDIPSWAQYCAQCFASKANPPPASYFERHFYNDPRKDSSLIRVIDYHPNDEGTKNGREGADSSLLSSSSTIVSSTRVFQKTISVGNGKTIEAGGIGEVCTSQDHRKKGLAKRLLLDAIVTMENERKMQCSLLHASAALTKVYERSAQYVSVTTKWSVMTVKMKELNERSRDVGTLEVRLASFPNDTTQLHRIHQQYSENRFAGCVIRSKAYWNEYLQYEIGQSLYVVSKVCEDNDEEFILGWVSIRPRGGRFQLREFGVDLDQCEKLGLTTSVIMCSLLKEAMAKRGIDDIQSVQVLLPTVIVQEMIRQNDFNEESCTWIDWSTEIKDDDDIGWMYKLFDSNCENEDENIVHVVNQLNTPHLIWPSDSF